MLAVCLVLGAPDAAVQTVTYKRVGDLEIKADVHRATDDVTRPVAVLIHGGALIGGHRQKIDERLKEMLIDDGYAVVSIDYRLAPETKLPAIVEDIEDALRWVREQGPRLFNVDTTRVAVLGGSAGGYLALTSGFRVEPRPTVLVSISGYGDLIGDWYTRPSTHPRHHRTRLTEEEARKQVSGPPISDARRRKGDGGAFYFFCRQRGIWPLEVTGWNPRTEEERFVPFMPLRNVTPDYPPTLLIHGTEDTDVPYEQAVMMSEELGRHGVEHELVSIPDAEHDLVGGDPELVDAAYGRVLEFVNRQMRR